MNKQEINRIKETLDVLESGFIGRAQQLQGWAIQQASNDIKEIVNSGKIPDNYVFPGRTEYITLFRRYIQELFTQGMLLGYLEVDAKRKQYAVATDYKPVIPERSLRWFNNWTNIFGNDYYDDLTGEVVRVLRSSMSDGLLLEPTIDRLSAVLTGDDFNFRRLEVIARTNSTTAFNQGRMEFFRQNDDFVKAVQYMAILDSRTTDICESRDGKIILIDDEATISENTPPLHYQCRSILSPVDKFELMEMQGSRDWGDMTDWSGVDQVGEGFGSISQVLFGRNK